MKTENRGPQRWLLFAICLAALGGVLWSEFGSNSVAQNVHEPETYTVIGPGGKPRATYTTPAEIRAVNQAKIRLDQLWWQRHSKDVVRDVLPYAQTRYADNAIQQRAVLILGRLENPAALGVLRDMEENLPSNKTIALNNTPGIVPQRDFKGELAFAVRMAIARIENRELKGREKIERVLAAIGLSVEQMKDVTVRADKDYSLISVAARIAMTEFFDLLYQQAKQGIDVSEVMAQFDLVSGSNILFDSVVLPPAEQTKFLLEKIGQGGFGLSQGMAEDVLNSSPQAADEVIAFAPHFANQPDKYHDIDGYVDILEIMARQGDKRAIEVMEKLVKNERISDRLSVSIALERIREGRSLQWQ